jgi:SAM-dependent methyltransferase
VDVIRVLRRVARRSRPEGGPTPRVGEVDLGDLRRTTPIGDYWGYDRGGPVDRYYIERFLDAHRADVRGRVLEVGDRAYTTAYGEDRVTSSDVLHVDPDAPAVTFVGDLADGSFLPSGAFDTIVLTQTLHLIFDPVAAMRTVNRILRPGGTLLLTVPGITQVDPGEWSTTWYYSFTQHTLRRLCQVALDVEEVELRSHGNPLAAVAFLHGLGHSELRREELDAPSTTHHVVHTLRARRQ